MTTKLLHHTPSTVWASTHLLHIFVPSSNCTGFGLVTGMNMNIVHILISLKNKCNIRYSIVHLNGSGGTNLNFLFDYLFGFSTILHILETVYFVNIEIIHKELLKFHYWSIHSVTIRLKFWDVADCHFILFKSVNQKCVPIYFARIRTVNSSIFLLICMNQRPKVNWCSEIISSQLLIS